MSALGDFLISKYESGGKHSNLYSAFTDTDNKNTGSSYTDNNALYQNMVGYLNQSVNKLYGQMQSSALKAAQYSADKVNAFNAQQAEINRRFQQSSAEKAMKFESEQAKRSMDFSERMANTQYQRAVADLKASGLSPLLAYNNMQTAAPQGVAASGTAASGSAASGVKAEAASAMDVDRKTLDRYITLLTLGVTSAMKVTDQSIAALGVLMSAIPGVNFTGKI